MESIEELLDETTRLLSKAEDFISNRGYVRCNMPACNCGSWHGGHAERRLEEICGYIRENDMWYGTALDSIKFVFRAYGIDQENL